MDHCSAVIQLTSCYCDLTDTINGEKALDTELHAVLQLVCYSRQSIEYISDAYSNLMPAQCTVQTRKFSSVSSVQQVKMSADERINVVEDCTDVLSVFSSVSQVTLLPDKISAVITLDIVYRTADGSLSAVRRFISVENPGGTSQARLISARIADTYLRPDGAYIDGHISVEVNYQYTTSMEINRVESVVLDDENAYDPAQFPAVTLVRAEGESLWELAKAYHSSIERIKAMNELEDSTEGKMILIPKAI